MTLTSNTWKELISIFSNLNNFHSLEVVDRVSETQLQVGEKFKLNTLAVKGLNQFQVTIITNVLVSSFCFIWIPKSMSTAIRNILLLQCGNRVLMSKVDHVQCALYLAPLDYDYVEIRRYVLLYFIINLLTLLMNGWLWGWRRLHPKMVVISSCHDGHCPKLR